MEAIKLFLSRTAREVVQYLRAAELRLLEARQLLAGYVGRLAGESRSFGPPRGVMSLQEAVRSPSQRLTFELVQPAEKRLRTLPALSIHGEAFSGFSRVREYTTQALFFVEGSGISCTGFSSYAFITADAYIIDELSFDVWMNWRHHLLRRWKLPRRQKVSGTVVAVLEPQSATYGHWLLDLLPRLLWAKAHMDAKGVAARYLVHYRGKAHEKAAFSAIGIPEDHIIPWEPGRRLEADHWVIPSFTSFAGDNLMAQHIDALRQSLMRAAGPASPDAPRKLYLSRKNDKFRRVRNEDAVVEFLKSRGFTVVEPATLSFLEQVRLFSGAEQVVSTISSGLCNIVFMKPGAVVLEIFPPQFFMQIEWALCDLLGLRYYYAWADGVQPQEIKTKNRFADLTIDLDVLARTLALTEGGGAVERAT